MSNSFSCVGRLGKDSLLKDINGQPMLNFSLANTNGWGEKKTTLWLSCSLWGKQASALAPHLKKGRQIFVSGEIAMREYEKDGQTNKALDLRVKDVDFVGGNKDESSTTNTTEAPTTPVESAPSDKQDLPF